MDRTIIKFYNFDDVPDKKLNFAVIAARFNNEWIFCKHKDRQTLEIPGGRREAGESVSTTAKRELQEETGAEIFDLTPVCVYSVARNGEESMGALFFAEVVKFGELDGNSEIEKIFFVQTLPKNLTYPLIQPHLYNKVQTWLNLSRH